MSCIITHTVLTADSQTPNGNIYPLPMLEAAVRKFNKNRSKLPLSIEGRASIGNASHYVHNLTIVGKELRATIKILDTESGRIVQQLIAAKVMTSCSLCSIGTVSEDKVVTIDEITGIGYRL